MLILLLQFKFIRSFILEYLSKWKFVVKLVHIYFCSRRLKSNADYARNIFFNLISNFQNFYLINKETNRNFFLKFGLSKIEQLH